MAGAIVKLGKDAKLLRGTAGSQATIEITAIKDVTLTADKATADVTTRASGGWRSKKPTLKELSVEFKLSATVGNADVTAFKNAYLNDTGVSLWARDATSGEGPDADFHVTSFSRDEPLVDGITYSVKCEATDEFGRNPTWS